MKSILKVQFVVLLIGTLFAWVNFALEFAGWLRKEICATGCPAPSVNPFLTPCFYGALFFLAAFILNIAALRKKEGIHL